MAQKINLMANWQNRNRFPTKNMPCNVFISLFD